MAVELALNQEVATVVAPAPTPAPTPTKAMPSTFSIGPLITPEVAEVLTVTAIAGVILLLMSR